MGATADLDEQRHAVATRGPGGDALERFERNAAALPAVFGAAGVLEDLGRLGGVHRPNVVRKVRLDGELAVLKVAAGDGDEEKLALDAWTEAGVRCVPLIASGATPERWILTGWVPGRNLTPGEVTRWTPEVIGLAASLHVAAPDKLTPFAERWAVPLRSRLGLLRSAGVKLPDIRGALEDVCSGPKVILHTDLAFANLLDADGLVVLDPFATAGPAEFDVARWLARTHQPWQVSEDIDDALKAYPRLSRHKLRLCLGLDLLVRSGDMLNASRHVPPAEFPQDLPSLGLAHPLLAQMLDAGKALLG